MNVSTSPCKKKKNIPETKRCRVAPHIQNLPKSGIRAFFDLVNEMKDVVSLGVGEPDFVTPWTIRETALYSLERGHTCYTSNLGSLSLRKAICSYLESDFGVEYKPQNECLVTVGVSEALDLAIRAILSPGDELIYHENILQQVILIGLLLIQYVLFVKNDYQIISHFLFSFLLLFHNLV